MPKRKISRANLASTAVITKKRCTEKQEAPPKSDRTSIISDLPVCANQTQVCSGHTFSSDEIVQFKTKLLNWYDKEQRQMPWRTIAKTEQDINKRIYAVWVSEVMLHQTQVSTVVPFYNSWLQRWPTVQSLASAQLDEVHRCWAGLGYYSRATRLHQGAQTIVQRHSGVFPTTAAGLEAAVPGVGRYTAAAVASIAAGQAVAVLDGNVARVAARIRGVGADTKEKRTQECFWRLSGDLLESARPGDSNQALMELGATVCTPKKVRCDICPVQDLCYAYRKSSLAKFSTDYIGLKNSTSKGGARTLPLLNHFSFDSKNKITPNNRLGAKEICCDIENGEIYKITPNNRLGAKEICCDIENGEIYLGLDSPWVIS